VPDIPEVPEPGPQPEPLTPLADRIASRRVGGRLFVAVLFAGVAAASGWLLAPGNAALRLPGDDALGTPAVGTFKAARDYDIPDEETTRRRREEAAAAERHVYDHDDGALEETVARVREAFQIMRDAQAGRRRQTGGEREDGPGLRAAFAARRGAFVAQLQTVVRDDDFAALSDARFSEAAEQHLVGLARQGLADPVVQDREVLAGERERGVVVREVRAGVARSEHAVVDLQLVRDVAQARADVEQAAAGLPRAVPARLRAALTRLAVSLVRPTLTLNQAETQHRQREAAERVKPVVVPVKRGERIISDGERIEGRHLVVFKGIRAQTRPMERASARLGGGALVAVLVLLLWRYARRGVPGFQPSRKDALLLAVLFVGALGLATEGLWAGDALHDRFPSIAPESFYYLVPFAAGAMLVRSVIGAEAALLLSVAVGAAVALAAGHSVFFGLFAALTSVAASALAAGTRGRRGFFRAGAAVGGLGALLVVATYLFTGRGPADLGGAGLAEVHDMAASALGAFLGGAVVLPITVLALSPIVEGVFGYVTDVKLLELANLNHPALKELIVQAPGTYHHSIVMGSLVEAAAEAIGANALLARVSAYYHDVGKTRNPLYFAENQRSENRHEALAPSMSALIVKRHVTDGLELAAHWKLPRPVADVIQQHHGTRQVSFFWAKAQKAAEEERAGLSEGARGEGLEEAAYRYPGPKPQSREAALVMIADTCEASSRALPDPSAERLGALVQRRVNEIFSEGQLDECDLTLRDLNAIAAAMVRALEAVYHTRPEYPGRPPPGEDRPPGVHLVART
jgi:hypothetical protein